MPKLFSLIRNLFLRARVEKDLDQEVGSYLEMLADEKIARGASEVEARRQARIELGGADRVKETVRDVRMGARVEMLWQDLRYAFRALRKGSSFTLVAVSIIALGIGANTAVFSVFNAVLLRPLPYDGEKQIVAVWEKRIKEDALRVPLSAADFLDWRRLAKTLSVALYETTSMSITGHGDAERVPAARVTSGFFEALHVQPRLGHTFDLAAEDPGQRKAAILTYGAWQRRFAGDPAILGKSIHLDGEPFEVTSVLPETFRYPFAAACELFVPVRFTPEERRFRGIHQYNGIARVRDGFTIGQARAEMDTISKQLERDNPDSNAGHATNLIPLHEDLAHSLRPALLVLFGAVFLVILIACANVANLMLARAAIRGREMAVRAALGCSKSRLLLQSFMESALLAAAGAIGGIALAWWGLAALRSAFFSRLDFFSTAGLNNIGIDWRVFIFILACAILSTLLFGVAPAQMTARVNLNQSLARGGRGSISPGRHSFRSGLVVVQVALSLILLTGAGLLAKSFLHLMKVNPGFQPAHLLTAYISLPGAAYRTNSQAATFYDALLERAKAFPQTKMAAVTDILPLSGDDNRAGVEVEGRNSRPGERIRMHPRLISPEYMETMGIHLLQGRMFTAVDATAKHQVGIVSEGTVRRYWPNGNALGKRFRFTIEKAPWIEVVGIAGSVRHQALNEESTPDVYMPYRENPFRYAPTRVALVIKSDGDDALLARSIRATVSSLDRSVAVSDVRSMESYLSDSTAPNRFNLVLLTLFAAMAIALAAAGLYGILSYTVSQSTAELGIRMALGAEKWDVLRMVLGRGFLLACIGIALGTGVSLAITQLMSKLLFGVQPRDATIFVTIPVFLVFVALVSSYIPARRAARVDPLTALRME